MDESKLDENRIGRKAVDQNRLDKNWAHDFPSSLELWLVRDYVDGHYACSVLKRSGDRLEIIPKIN